MLRRHEPDHILLKPARADAATGLLDIRRLGEMLTRISGRIVHQPLDHVSPLGVSITADDTDGRFAYQGILGAAFPIASVPGLAITAEYRFLGTLSPRINTQVRDNATGIVLAAVADD